MPFALPRYMLYPALLPLMPTPRLPAVDRTDAHRPISMDSSVWQQSRNLVYARVPSYFKHSLPKPLVVHTGSKHSLLTLPTCLMGVYTAQICETDKRGTAALYYVQSQDSVCNRCTQHDRQTDRQMGSMS